jgi:ParB-like chromosome segregation protein Spo0J
MQILNREMGMKPVGELRPHPRNPNHGDVGAIYESIAKNGFFGVVGYQMSTGYILFGNHRYEAALQAGATEIPAVGLDVADDEALRILLVDNRTARLATDDENVLAEVLQELAATRDGLGGTGFTGDDLDDLLNKLGSSGTFADLEPEAGEEYNSLELTIRVARDRVSDELKLQVEQLAAQVGGRFIIKGSKGE